MSNSWTYYAHMGNYFFLPQRALAAARAISLRLSGDSFLALLCARLDMQRDNSSGSTSVLGPLVFTIDACGKHPLGSIIPTGGCMFLRPTGSAY